MKSVSVKYLLCCLVAAAFASCADSDVCQQDMNSAVLKVVLYRTAYDEAAEIIRPEEYALPVSVSGVGVDSLLYDSSFTSKLSLPLSKFDTVSGFVITSYHIVDDSTTLERTDTLSVFHQNELALVSLECGCAVEYNITNVRSTVHAIDSCLVENSGVSAIPVDNNMRIYFNDK